MKWVAGILGAALYAATAQADTYALLIRGSDKRSYVYHTSAAYKSLLKSGVPRENIIILGTSKTKYHPLDGDTSKESLANAFSSLEKRITPQDTFILWMRDHGTQMGENTKESLFILDNEATEGKFGTVEWLNRMREHTLSVPELREYMKNIHPQRGYLLFDFCYSGQFGDVTVNKEFIAFTSAMNEPSASRRYFAWSNYLLNAIMLKKGDRNRDGNVTPLEMLEYAKGAAATTRPYVSTTNSLDFFNR